MLKRMICDWRGGGKWSAADRSRKADYVSCWQTWTEQPIPGVPTLPVFSLTVYAGGPANSMNFTEPWGISAYTKEMFLHAPDGSFRKVWERDDGTARALALDPTKRGFIAWLAPQIVARFSWAQGLHWDYVSDLAWLFPDIDPAYWPKYRAAMESLAAEIRRLRPDWILLGQNYHWPEGMGGHFDGLFLEQTPTNFGQTLQMHAERLAMHRELMKLAGRRPSLWVCEIREPARIKTLPGGETYLLNVAAWCEAQGVVVSWGRDSSAGVGFPPA